MRDVSYFLPVVRVESLEHVKPHVPDIHPRPHRPERRAWEHEGALGAEVLPAPLATRPEPHEAAAGGLERKPGADADPQRAALDGVDGRGRHTMVEHEHPLRSRFTVGSERAPCARLIERHSEKPETALAVRLTRVLGHDPGAPAGEVGAPVPQVDDAPVRSLVVDGRERSGRAEQGPLAEARRPPARERTGRRQRLPNVGASIKGVAPTQTGSTSMDMDAYVHIQTWI